MNLIKGCDIVGLTTPLPAMNLIKDCDIVMDLIEGCDIIWPNIPIACYESY